MKTVANDLRRHLPYARRFARALCGSQEHGDAYIVRTLETLISDRSIFDGYDSRKNALFATFLKLWNAEPAGSPQQAPLAENALMAAADRKLQALPPKSRQAFLLVSMENFTMSDTAQILGVNPNKVSGLIETATMDIASEISTDVLIIEDEPLVAMDLEAAMQEIGHRVIGVASTHAEAVEMVKGKKPGLVLADIQLADGSSGLDAVNEMLSAFEAPVIFITAFPERLLTGEKPEPAFLITKPFDLNVVKAISSQALFFDQNARRSEAAAESAAAPADRNGPCIFQAVPLAAARRGTRPLPPPASTSLRSPPCRSPHAIRGTDTSILRFSARRNNAWSFQC